jgi:phospholipase C
MGAANPWSKIKHIVVVMFENRSFDNLLGWLYDPANPVPFNVVPPDFEGLCRKDAFNPNAKGGRRYAGKSKDPRSPQPNPGEPFEDVYSQIYDVPRVSFEEMSPVPPHAPNMLGFIRNYREQKQKPRNADAIMDSLTPKTVPVLSTLAHHYAVCDHWFASIPTQTFCNRSFVHSGTSSGYVNNGGSGLCFVNHSPTIFDLLENADLSWNVFVGGWLLQSFTLLTQRSMWKYARTHHFAHFEDFLAAAARKDGLPSYSFIEPIYFDSLVWGPENDMHPECNPYEFYGPSNLHRGEALLASIYPALRKSPAWESILLVILFDEHGGCYDHVPPPSSTDCDIAINPDGIVIPKGQPGGIGFNFDRLGPRVPAIVVSAYTPPQTRLHDIFEHTSVLSTVVNCFDLPRGQLGERQAKARDLRGAITLPAPRTDAPNVVAPTFSWVDEVKARVRSLLHADLRHRTETSLSSLQRSALHGVTLLTETPELHDRIEKLNSEHEADLLLAEHEAKVLKS